MMFSRAFSTAVARFVRPRARRLSGAVAVTLFCAACSLPAAAAEAPASLFLTGKPSEMLTASDGQWQAMLASVQPLMEARRAGWAGLSLGEQIEWHIHAAVLAQAQGRWQAVIDAVKAARALQPSEAGRQTAGLLNELLARQAQGHGDEPTLRRITREAVLAMPWAEVEPAIMSIRQALVGMDANAVRSFVESRMDLSTGITKGQVTLPFVMQLLGARFQLQQVLPHRAALMVGLDDAIRERAAGAAR